MKFSILAVLIVFGLFDLSKAKNNPLPNSPQMSPAGKIYKLFVLYPGYNSKKMQMFNYKNLVITENEAVIYNSDNPKTSEADAMLTTTNYLYTQLFQQINLPCINNAYVCTFGQIKKEYSKIFPEINFAIPQDISKGGQLKNPDKQCLVLTFQPFMTLDDCIWLCHFDIRIILELQMKISINTKKALMKNLEIYIDYYPADSSTNQISASSQFTGLLNLESDIMKFTRQDTKKVLLDLKYLDIKQFAYNYYLKEKFPLNDKKDYDSRCLKMMSTTQHATTYVFCVFFGRGDFTKSKVLNPVQARWASKFYVQILNLRILEAHLASSLGKIAEIKSGIEIEGDLILPAAIKMRQEYLFDRHRTITLNKLDNRFGEMKLRAVLEDLKNKKITEVCNGMDLCERALKYEIQHGFLPLKDFRERIAMDITNPYFPLTPKVHIKINTDKKTIGEEIIKQIDKIKGAQNYLAEQGESIQGEFPSVREIYRAFKFLQSSKKKGQRFSQFNDIRNMCLSKESFRRKISYIFYSRTSDPYLDYLGSVKGMIGNLN